MSILVCGLYSTRLPSSLILGLFVDYTKRVSPPRNKVQLIPIGPLQSRQGKCCPLIVDTLIQARQVGQIRNRVADGIGFVEYALLNCVLLENFIALPGAVDYSTVQEVFAPEILVVPC